MFDNEPKFQGSKRIEGTEVWQEWGKMHSDGDLFDFINDKDLADLDDLSGPGGH